VWWEGMDGATPLANQPVSVIKGLVAVNVYDKGIYNYQTRNLEFEDCVFSNEAEQGKGFGYFSSDYTASGLKMTRCTVEGFEYGTLLASGVVVGGESDQEFIDCYLYNRNNFLVSVLWVAGSPAAAIPPRHVTLRICRFGEAAGNNIVLDATPHGSSDSTNLIAENVLTVYDYNGAAGDSFRVYWDAQAPDAILQQSALRPDGSFVAILGSPDSGKTNAQNWADHGIAWGGAVMPASAVAKPGVVGGKVVPLTAKKARGRRGHQR